MAFPPAAAPMAGSPQPMPQAAPEPTNLDMAPDDLRLWWSRVELARQRRKKESDKWQKLLDNFLPPRTADANSINSNIHFRNTELKIAEVFAQMPELQLTPLEPLLHLVDPQTGQPFMNAQQQPMDGATLAMHVVSIKRAVLDKLLGRDHANVELSVREALFAVFATAGIGATKICYEADLQPTPMQVPGPSQPQPGAILNLQPMPGPMVTQVVPVPVHERFRWYHFSENKLLIPHDWHSTDYDEAGWLGMEFVIPLAKAKVDYGLPDDFQSNVSRDDLLLQSGERDPGEGVSDLVKGVEIWMHTSRYDEQVAHSGRFRQLVLIEGMKDKPGQYRDSPYQSLDEKGRLTPDSMIGNPIHPLTLRVIADLAWIPSDAAFTDPLVRQENTWMSQEIKRRDASIPRFIHAAKITAAIDKLKDVDVGQGASVADEDMAGGIEKLIAQLPQLEQSHSDAAGHALIRRAEDETLGLGSNQAGALASTVRSATEVATVQANVSVRLKAERNRLMDWILRGVRKFDALVMRYADQDGQYVEILGADGAKQLAMWNQHVISGRFAYDAHPDSQVSIDEDSRRKRFLDFVNFMAKSPFMNQGEIARLAALEFGYDPSRLVKDPQPPGPPPPNVSVKVDINDLAGPVGGAALKILQQAGYQLTTQDLQLAQGNAMIIENAQALQQMKPTQHGGAADRAETLSQHHGDLTGAMPGQTPAGAPPATATPGRVQ